MAEQFPADHDPWRGRIAELILLAWTGTGFRGRYSTGFGDRISDVAELAAAVAPQTAAPGELADDEFDRLARDVLRHALPFFYPEPLRQLGSDLIADFARWPSPYDPDVWQLHVAATIAISWVDRAFSARMTGATFAGHLDRVAAMIDTVAPQVPGQLTDAEADRLAQDLRGEIFFIDDMTTMRCLARDLVAERARWRP